MQFLSKLVFPFHFLHTHVWLSTLSSQLNPSSSLFTLQYDIRSNNGPTTLYRKQLLFVYVISHFLNTNLAAVSSWSHNTFPPSNNSEGFAIKPISFYMTYNLFCRCCHFTHQDIICRGISDIFYIYSNFIQHDHDLGLKVQPKHCQIVCLSFNQFFHNFLTTCICR